MRENELKNIIAHHPMAIDDRNVRVVGRDVEGTTPHFTILNVPANSVTSFNNLMGRNFEEVKRQAGFWIKAHGYISGYANVWIFINGIKQHARNFAQQGMWIFSPYLDIIFENNNAFAVYPFIQLTYIPNEFYHYDKPARNLDQPIDKVTVADKIHRKK